MNSSVHKVRIKGHLKQVDTQFTGRLIEIPKRITYH